MVALDWMAADWMAAAMVGGAVFLLVAGGVRRLSPALALPSPIRRPAVEADTARWARTCLLRVGGTTLASRLGRTEALRRRLELDGHPKELQAFRGLQVLVGTGCVCLTVLLGAAFPPALIASPLAAVAGVRVPEMILARRARRRQDRIAAAVPDLAEVLLATTEAGLSPAIALGRTAEVMTGPLGEEVRAAVAEVQLGEPWHRAMQGLTARTEVGSLRALVVAVERSQRLGSELAMTLRRVADDLRADRRSRAEEAARKAPLKMLFPLVFLILPSFLLLTVGPVVLATLRSLR